MIFAIDVMMICTQEKQKQNLKHLRDQVPRTEQTENITDSDL